MIGAWPSMGPSSARPKSMGRSGAAITLLGPADLPKWREIERGLQKQFTRMKPNGELIHPLAGSGLRRANVHPAPAKNGHAATPSTPQAPRHRNSSLNAYRTAGRRRMSRR